MPVVPSPRYESGEPGILALFSPGKPGAVAQRLTLLASRACGLRISGGHPCAGIAASLAFVVDGSSRNDTGTVTTIDDNRRALGFPTPLPARPRTTSVKANDCRLSRARDRVDESFVGKAVRLCVGRDVTTRGRRPATAGT